ncbi:MAG: tetratricopeptide repeat protein [gamma proteobacterium symbiont of Bathyaustriella thionipta]|nr:tetratricopeptide repeat protein [gamma proteobacterium symbiont of Bathyaustriella thionipta]
MVTRLIMLLLISSLLGACGRMGQRPGEPAPIIDRHQPSSSTAQTAAKTASPTTTAVTEHRMVSEEIKNVAPAQQRVAYAPPPEAEIKTQLATAEQPQSHTQQAVLSLQAKSEEQARSGNISGAVSTLERALRIEPKNARLWNRLAHLRLEQGQFQQAGDLAGKSNALAQNDSNLKRDNWLLISLARRNSGDQAGADKAEKQARQYEH